MRRILLLAGASLALAAAPPASAQQFVNGARSAGDPLVPGVGNGGYDVRAYRLALRTDAR